MHVGVNKCVHVNISLFTYSCIQIQTEIAALSRGAVLGYCTRIGGAAATLKPLVSRRSLVPLKVLNNRNFLAFRVGSTFKACHCCLVMTNVSRASFVYLFRLADVNKHMCAFVCIYARLWRHLHKAVVWT